MPERTSQPATQVGPNAAYAANCRFLWNAAVPNKNSLNGNDSTSGLKGTDNTGTAGKYRVFGADLQMSFGVTFPSGAYTLVVVHAFPVASRGSAQTVSTLSGTGFQCAPYTTGGGVYELYTHRGAANSTQDQVTGVGGFNTNPWVEVFAFTGPGGSPANQLRRYRKSGSGVETQGTETISYVNPSSTIYLGDGGGLTTQGVYAVMLVAGDIGATECELLRDNPWRMFEDEAGGSFSVSGAGGIASAQAFGSPSLSFDAPFSVTGAGGIASANAFGSPSLSFSVPFTVTGAGGIASSNAFGTATLNFSANGLLNFQAAGMEFGRRTGLGISTFALDAGASYRYSVHADGLTLGAAILTSSAITLDSNGKLPNLSSASITTGTTYRVVAIRQADGEAATFRMVAQ